MNFSKNDIVRSFIAGMAIAVLSLPVFENIKVFEKISGSGLFFIIAVWIIFLPLATVLGLYVFYRVANWKWTVLYQIGKYGIIGWLNVFVTGGIFNFFIFATSISTGLWVDVFYIIAFVSGITHSFFWNKFWIFQAEDKSQTKREYIGFFSVSTATSLINLFLMHLFVNIIGAPAGMDPTIWANIIFFSLIPVSFFGNFFGYRVFVFKRAV